MIQMESVAILELSAHPFAVELYGDDPRADSDFEDLVASVRAHGVIEAVLATTDGTIINGRRRVAAAREVGLSHVPIRRIEGLDDPAQREMIVTLNLHRKRTFSIMVREVMALVGTDFGLSSQAIVNSRSKALSRAAARVGFANKKEFDKAFQVAASGDNTLIQLMDRRTVESAFRRLHKKENRSRYSPIIKPSDNWNFSPIHFPRIDNSDVHGYIPGDIYANCFWYFAKPNDVVVDPMAGSGMARHVYEARNEWMGEMVYDFNLHLFDLTPQRDDILQHDLMAGFPVEHANYIFIDPPYLQMSAEAYSEKATDLANMDEEQYRTALRRIASVCSTAQKPDDLCTVVSPNYVNHEDGQMVNMVDHIRDCWRQAGYTLYLETFSSRRIQRTQTTRMAAMNNRAKERRLPLSDIAVVMTFKRLARHSAV